MTDYMYIAIYLNYKVVPFCMICSSLGPVSVYYD